jgi:hypothetical protein
MEMNPFGGTAFDLTYNLAERMRRLESEQHVNMIASPADCFGNRVYAFSYSTKIRVQLVAPRISYSSSSLLRAENNVIVPDVRHSEFPRTLSA